MKSETTTIPMCYGFPDTSLYVSRRFFFFCSIQALEKYLVNELFFLNFIFFVDTHQVSFFILMGDWGNFCFVIYCFGIGFNFFRNDSCFFSFLYIQSIYRISIYCYPDFHIVSLTFLFQTHFM
jgi:hypothetical protein